MKSIRAAVQDARSSWWSRVFILQTFPKFPSLCRSCWLLAERCCSHCSVGDGPNVRSTMSAVCPHNKRKVSSMHRTSSFLIASIVMGGFFGLLLRPAYAQDISDTALQQIKELLDEKDSRT